MKNNFKFTINGSNYTVDILDINNNIAKIEVNGTPYDVELAREVVQETKTPTIVQAQVTTNPSVKKPQPIAGGSVKAPLPGIIIEISVKEGDIVNKGDKILIMEAMKMENNILAEKSGTVSAIKVKQGDNVLQGDVLIEIA